MKFSIYPVFIFLFFAVAAIHFAVLQSLGLSSEPVFKRYYVFLSLLFMMVLTVLTFVKKIQPNYIGFAFLGVVMLKLTLALLMKNRLEISEIPNFKLHFILPYLASLLIETLFAVKLIGDHFKDEKNQ